ncbi:MAG TPA: thioredoxin domain-containing protein [Acidimicrobiales bacterium]|nr:thioredoxin domain-containing protein [Acidimicrobiales bacterium]
MNRLADETSPYLQQHKDNPVDWYPWSEEAFAKARDEDKPVLLSVGYSACHWCHVMAHESFEDDGVASVMNELFVNVKVDREERPDVDSVYMEATQAMTGSGGWPMTVFLTPDGRPFFAGTYFPKSSGHGRPGFVDVMRAVHDAWSERRDDLLQQADQLSEAVRARSTLASQEGGGAALTSELVAAGVDTLHLAFEPEWGGFGRAPKFPQASFLELLMRDAASVSAAATEDRTSTNVVATTLDAMASGGIHDHLGGGFARYSVDAFWMVPHFEKMLYDQAQLLRVYVHGHQQTGNPHWRLVAEEIVAYVRRDLRQPGGGLSSAEDADSEGEEGKFYVWRPEEIAEVLQDDELTAEAIEWWGVTRSGNFEGSNILHRPRRGDLVRHPRIDAARRRLLAHRSEHRVRPGLDDKVLTEWNAMFVSALAEAGAALQRPDWLDEAAATADFLLAHLLVDGRWRRSWQQGRTVDRLLAYAVDHAWLVDAFTRLAEARGEARWIDAARDAADALLELFWDDADGGLFTVGHDGEQLIVRQKDSYDGATPSANGVAAVALLRLGALTGEARYRDHATRILEWLAPSLAAHPQAFTYALAAVDLVARGIDEIAVVGDRRDLVAAVQRRHLPNAVLAWGERYDSPLWEDRQDGLAYVCRDFACRAPVGDVDALVVQLAPSPATGP